MPIFRKIFMTSRDVIKHATGTAIGKLMVDKVDGAGEKKKENRPVKQKTERGELLADILSLGEENKKLIEYLKRALGDQAKEETIRLLCQLPKKTRREVFGELNSMNYEEFQKHIEIFKERSLGEFLEEAEKQLRKTSGKANKEMNEMAGELNKWSDKRQKRRGKCDN